MASPPPPPSSLSTKPYLAASLIHVFAQQNRGRERERGKRERGREKRGERDT
jgi:hypothetical protein